VRTVVVFESASVVDEHYWQQYQYHLPRLMKHYVSHPERPPNPHYPVHHPPDDKFETIEIQDCLWQVVHCVEYCPTPGLDMTMDTNVHMKLPPDLTTQESANIKHQQHKKSEIIPVKSNRW
jgi:hypothetical protein